MKRRQQGAHIVEFAVAATALFMLLFGVIEVARLLFMWNSLAEATQRGAQVAAVCAQDSPHIEAAVRFLPQLEGNGAVTTVYNADGFGNIMSVTVTLTGYQFQLMIPFFSPLLTAPDFSTTLPIENFGATPGIPPC